jgi:hypothetical protein
MTNNAAAPSRSSTGRAALVAALVATLAITACSDEDRRELGAQDAQESLERWVEQAVAARGMALDGDLSCTAAIADDSVVTSSCDGTTTSGTAVTGTFDGTADVSDGAETCAVHLIVSVADDIVADEPAVDCFDVG